MAETLRLGLVHPRRAWLEAFECLLAPREDVSLVIAHADEAWVRSAVGRGQVDVVILGLDGPEGVAQVRRMREARSDVGIVVMSDDDTLVPESVRAGARGWLAQTSTVERMLAVVHGVARGETWYPPRHVTRLVDALLRAADQRQHDDDVLACLSDREREILDSLALGMTRAEIAAALYLSPNTVRTHINHILRKLDVHSTLAAVSLARRSSLGRPGEETG